MTAKKKSSKTAPTRKPQSKKKTPTKSKASKNPPARKVASKKKATRSKKPAAASRGRWCHDWHGPLAPRGAPGLGTVVAWRKQ